MHLSTTLLCLVAGLSNALSISSRTSPTIDCKNIAPKNPFFLSVSYTNVKGNFVAQAVQIYDPFHSSTYQLRAAGHHDHDESKFEFKQRRLTFNVTDSAPFPGGTFTSKKPVKGKPLGFTTSDKKKGNLGLIDTDVPKQGDAGCGVAVDMTAKIDGFTLCSDSIGNQVVYWKNYSKKMNCFKVDLVARNDKP